MTEIRCATCLLRPFLVSDAEALAKHANDRDVWINLRDRFPHPYGPEHAVAYAEHLATEPIQTSFAIVVDGSAMGGISLVPGTDVERISAEVGYWIGKAFWGRGIVTEALRAITTYGFDAMHFHRVFALPFADNPSSVRVLEKAGYIREGSMRRSTIKENRIRDQFMYAAYDDTWAPRETMDGGFPAFPIG